MNRRQFLSSGSGALVATSLHAQTAGSAQITFPKDFLFGTGTSAMQIEGAWQEDGKSESNWDHLAHMKGKIKGAYNLDVACDSYHRYPQDIACLKAMHQQSYRFSIAWPRILPNGTGQINQKGLDHYKRMVDAMLAANIRPNCTLYHWDLPQVLEERGGWPNRDCAKWFADYAAVVVKALSDRIKVWAMLNEPLSFTQAGYTGGTFAPGIADPILGMRASHTANLAQGLGFRAIKAIDSTAQVGGAFNISAVTPATDSPEDIALADQILSARNLWYIHPAMKGHYPEAAYPKGMPYKEMNFQPGDEGLMLCPLDWIGVNYYRRSIVSARAKTPGQKLDAGGLTSNAEVRQKGDLTDMGWEIWPAGIHHVLTRVAREYNNPIIEVCENGCSYLESPDEHLRVRDDRRIAFFREHLFHVRRAITDGVRVRAYHAWSLLDNFELLEGYTQRFGLVYVDFRTQRRILKDSAMWYGEVARTHTMAHPDLV
jgi:beta-glucosidase